MAKPRPANPPEEVAEAAAKVRAFHAIGTKNLASRGGRGKLGDRALAREAAELGISAVKLGQARRFADPVAGFAAAELEAFLAACAAAGFAAGTEFIVLLLTVTPKSVRRRLQEKALRGRWSRRKMKDEIARRFDAKGKGGRRPRVPGDNAGILARLGSACESWRRLHAELMREPGGKGAAPKLQALPEALRKELGASSRAVAKLQAQVARELDGAKPGRAAEAAEPAKAAAKSE